MKPGKLRFVCISHRKGIVKKAVSEVSLRAGHGIEGDAHAGDWHRQISLLDNRDIDSMRAMGLQLEAGAFGENLVVEGLDLGHLGIGSRLRAGDVELEITQIGKVCHHRCAIYHRTGDCIMPRAGLFAEVLQGGKLEPGVDIKVTREIPRGSIQVAVLTVSDSCSRGEAEDTAGPAVIEKISEAFDAHIAWRGIEADDRDRLVERLGKLCDRRLDLVFTVGGTGCAPRDLTPEATRVVIDREVPGLAEAMRAASGKITPHALLQRGIAGIARSTMIVNLPGSPRAATENLEIALPALPHAVRLLRGDTAHPEDPRKRVRSDRRPTLGGAFA